MEWNEFSSKQNLDPCDWSKRLDAWHRWKADNPVEAAHEEADREAVNARALKRSAEAETRRKAFLATAAEMRMEPYFDYEYEQHMLRCLACGESAAYDYECLASEDWSDYG